MSAGPVAVVWSVSMAVRATVVLGAAGLVALALRGAAASWRHRVWCLAAAGLLALPGLAAVLPGLDVPVPFLPAGERPGAGVPARVVAPGVASAHVVLVPLGGGEAASVPRARAASADSGPGSGRDRGLLLLLAWGLGAGVLLARLGWGRIALARLRARSRPAGGDSAWSRLAARAAARLGVDRDVPVLVSDEPVSPTTFGVLRPVVVVPAFASSWPEARRFSILLHELAHVRRRDALARLVADLARVLWWFHPGVWLASRRLRVEQERACDDAVLRSGRPAGEYARDLVATVRDLRSARPCRAGLALASGPWLPDRVERLLEGSRSRADLPRAGGVALTVGAAVLGVALAAARPVGSAPHGTPGRGAGVVEAPGSRVLAADRVGTGPGAFPTEVALPALLGSFTGRLVSPAGSPAADTVEVGTPAARSPREAGSHSARVAAQRDDVKVQRARVMAQRDDAKLQGTRVPAQRDDVLLQRARVAAQRDDVRVQRARAAAAERHAVWEARASGYATEPQAWVTTVERPADLEALSGTLHELGAGPADSIRARIRRLRALPGGGAYLRLDGRSKVDTLVLAADLGSSVWMSPGKGMRLSASPDDRARGSGGRRLDAGPPGAAGDEDGFVAMFGARAVHEHVLVLHVPTFVRRLSVERAGRLVVDRKPISAGASGIQIIEVP